MNNSRSKAELKLKQTLRKNIHISVMIWILTKIIGVEIPPGANAEWVAQSLSEHIIAKGSIASDN
jgi:hypothetical protein